MGLENRARTPLQRGELKLWQTELSILRFAEDRGELIVEAAARKRVIMTMISSCSLLVISS